MHFYIYICVSILNLAEQDCIKVQLHLYNPLDKLLTKPGANIGPSSILRRLGSKNVD